LAWYTPSARCTSVDRIRYVAQENLVAIEAKADRKISHDLLPHVFEDFDAERAAYRPVQQLRVWYPADDLAPPEAQPELQQQRLDGVVRATAATLDANPMQSWCQPDAVLMQY
jgi:hypothetical protein